MERNPVNWFEIYVNDMRKAQAFYEGLLQIQLKPLPAPPGSNQEALAFPGGVDNAGATGSLTKMLGDEQPSGSGTIIYFSSDECAAVASRASQFGGTVLRNKFSIGAYGFIALVTDPAGNVVGIHSMR